jgi:polyisoprenoid-binding protein YceI
VTTTSAPVLTAGRWTLDTTSSTATFRVGNLGRTVTGSVPITGGTVEVDPDGRPTAIAGSLDLASIDTGHARRDRDLRKPGLLDLDRHPTMTFSADAVGVSPEGWSVTGQLTARGTRVELVGDVQLSVLDGSATTDSSVALVARTRLDRRAIGVRAPRLMIGRQVDITVTATLRRPAAG